METDPLTQAIIGAAIQVHNWAWLARIEIRTCLAYELASRGLEALRQVQLPVLYKGIHLRVWLADRLAGRAHSYSGSQGR